MTKVEIIQKALEDKKATNIEVLDVASRHHLRITLLLRLVSQRYR